MKKKFINLVKTGKGALLLLILMLVGITQAKAQETYGLQIAGVDVTSENCNDLSVIPGVSGTVKYDAATKTLTLENATIAAKGDTLGIYNSSIKGFIINVTGINNVTTDNAAIITFKSTTIQGDGTLNAESFSRSCIAIETGTLTIDNCSLNAKGSYYGISGNSGEETLTIKNDATVTAEGLSGSITNFTSLNLNGSGNLVKPYGAEFNTTLKSVTLDGELVGSQVIIGKSLTYGLKIAGIDVTTKNCYNLNSITGVSGTVEYNPNTNTLSLDNATIALQGNTEGILNYSDSNLIINVTGENKITSNLSALALAQSTTIQGGGTLNATSVNGSGIAIDSTTLTVNPCTVNAKGAYGISGNGTDAMLSAKIGSTVTAEGSNGSVVGIDSLALESDIDLDTYVEIGVQKGVAIITPNRAAYDKTLKAVAVNGVVATDKVLIGELIVYGVFINGEYVTNANCNDLSVLPDVSGAMTFDPNTFTLTLKNAVINTERKCFAIRYDNERPNFTIRLLGENHIITNGSPFGILKAPTTITGGGTLDMLTAYSIAGDSLTFDDCTINIKSYDYAAITGCDTYTVDRSVLTIRNSDFTAELVDKTESYGCFGTISSELHFILDGCEIVQPVGAAFDDTLHAVAINGEPTMSKVVIRRTGEKYGLKVAGVDVTSNNCNDLSVIDGVSGTAKYDPETKTLFLENATIEATGDNKGIVNDSIDGLVINVTGENTIKARHTAIMLNDNPTIVKGYGTLNTEAENGMGLYFNNSLEIDNCTANFNGNWGLTGKDGTCEKLTINNATVTMNGTESSHADINSLTLVNSVISTPKGAAFSDALHAIALNGKAVTSSITIKPDTTKRYDVVLEAIPADKNAAVALVQNLTGLGETESEALVESAPCIICSDVSVEEAHEICHEFAKLNCAANNYLLGTWENVVSIKDVKAPVSARKQGIYSLEGIYLGTDFNALPKGIYIKDGKKVMK